MAFLGQALDGGGEMRCRRGHGAGIEDVRGCGDVVGGAKDERFDRDNGRDNALLRKACAAETGTDGLIHGQCLGRVGHGQYGNDGNQWGVLGKYVAVAPGPIPHGLFPVPGLEGGDVHERGQVVLDEDQHVPFGRDMVVQRRGSHVEGPRQGSHGEPVVAALANQLQGRHGDAVLVQHCRGGPSRTAAGPGCGAVRIGGGAGCCRHSGPFFSAWLLSLAGGFGVSPFCPYFTGEIH
ncbi:hypothetical protein SRABI128_04390 [Microbacterium sp. Bi128]|nr:hypothetical protein SRABI128_04390 [Microbacterium sp. Bi128]